MEAVGFSPHVQQLAASAGVDGKLIIWDLNTLTERGVCQHPDVSGVARSKEHPWVVGQDCVLRECAGWPASFIRVLTWHRLPRFISNERQVFCVKLCVNMHTNILSLGCS